MPAHNADIEKIFNKVADLLEIEEANQFRVRAYRNGARAVSGLSENVADMLRQGKDLRELPDIGEDLASKIQTIVETGSLPLLEELLERLPAGLMELLDVPGLGPRKVAALYKELGIQDAERLKEAAEGGEIRKLSGFGKKTEQNILDELTRLQHGEKQRVKLADAEQYAEPLRDYLQQLDGVGSVTLAGSYRRRKQTVGDLDILVTCEDSSPVMQAFVDFEDVRKVVSQGGTRSTVILRSGLQVDLRVVADQSFGAALHYFTGSKAHNIAVRKLGLAKDYKINEYGVFQGDERVAGSNEEEIYAKVDLPYIEPELRENTGEIEAAQQGGLPKLLTVQDLRGDLHTHSKETDGRDSLEDLAKAAKDMGYEYLAVTDHSKRIAVANGMDEERLRRQADAIDELNDSLEGVVLLKGVEVDILKDGSLDLSDEVLELLDLRVCSVHSHFRLGREEQTSRLLKAMDNPLCNIIAHPTARKINEREPLNLDLHAIMQGARERGCFLEVNAQPERLDLDDVHLRHARELGLRVVVSTDAHWSGHLKNIRYGVDQARRGWIQARDVINTEPLAELRKLFKR